MTRISVCGLGKLGSPIAAVFAVSDVSVMGYDTDVRKVELLSRRRPPVDEPQLAEYLALPEVRKNLRASAFVADAVRSSEATLFVTPTPSLADGSFDHTLLLTAISTVAREVSHQYRNDHLFIINSTTVPGFMRGTVEPTLRRLLHPLSFHLAYKPEFIALGTVIRDLHNPDLLLIGSEREETHERVESLYREMLLIDSPAKRVSLTEAELAKISLNCAVTMKISFANQVGLVAQKLGADPAKVLDAVGEDKRVGHGALRPGLPFGGPCFPRDNRMFQYVAGQVGERAPLSEATDTMNRRTLRLVADGLPPTGDVGILGLSYKPGTSFTEESPGMWWRQALLSRGRRVKTHDVAAPHTHTVEEVLACPIVIVATAWEEYKSLAVSESTFLVDPMGVLRPAAEMVALRSLPVEEVVH